MKKHNTVVCEIGYTPRSYVNGTNERQTQIEVDILRALYTVCYSALFTAAM